MSTAVLSRQPCKFMNSRTLHHLFTSHSLGLAITHDTVTDCYVIASDMIMLCFAPTQDMQIQWRTSTYLVRRPERTWAGIGICKLMNSWHALVSMVFPVTCLGFFMGIASGHPGYASSSNSICTIWTSCNCHSAITHQQRMAYHQIFSIPLTTLAPTYNSAA